MNTKLTQSQLDAYWMPFTGNRQFKNDPRIINGADGCYFTDGDGRQIFDGLSGLWTCGLGHNVKTITEAIAHRRKNSISARHSSLDIPKHSSLPRKLLSSCRRT